MYDFKAQEDMLHVSLDLLEHGGVDDVYALGGGTALSAFYWQHRFSTDIDIFIYTKDRDVLHKIDPRYTSEVIKKKLEALHYIDDLKNNGVYMELAIDNDKKMQFFPAKSFTSTSYTWETLWGKEIHIESIEEIIAKKIKYRCGKGNARDLFDIAVAISKNASILVSMNPDMDNLKTLLETVNDILDDKKLMKGYLDEISLMEPAADYRELSVKTIEFLSIFLNEYIQASEMRMAGIDEFCEEILIHVHNELAS